MRNATLTAWILLGVAIVGELVGTACLKLANGTERPWAWLGVVAGYGTALWLLNEVIQQIDIGVVYALWSGVGIALVALCGVLFFGETMTLARAAGIFAIVIGIALIQLEGRH
jgi:multidrug transporter EmrE-like cation transporter